MCLKNVTEMLENKLLAPIYKLNEHRAEIKCYFLSKSNLMLNTISNE